MAEVSETLKHPIFGSLGWLPKDSQWFTRYTLPSGRQLDVFVKPQKGDRHAFLKLAADLFCWAIENERSLFQQAMQTYLLELYNDGWRQEDDPLLSADDFSAQLEWQFLEVSDSEIVPITFGYDPGDLFGGHVVFVKVDASLRFRGAQLVG
jgi:hypothetical protein